ncbi:hypothetical protein DV738_g2725, partial [Chaetothyriales sp. CBS 135597]
MEAVAAATPPQLPARLLRFFAKYPPQLYGAKFTQQTIPVTKKEAKLRRIAQAAEEEEQKALRQAQAEEQQLRNPPAAAEEQQQQQTQQTLADPNALASSSSPQQKFPPNPFLPIKTSGKRWLSPRIGLRRQAELFKLAKKSGVEALLPVSRKSTEFKQQRLLLHGLRIRGTGEGQKVKGHKWERQHDDKMEERYKAIVNMPALVREWQARGHGRGFKKEQFPKVRMP